MIIFYVILAVGLSSWFLYLNYHFQDDIITANDFYKKIWTQEIDKSYQDVLNRSADQAGLQHYLTLVTEKKMDINDVRRSLQQSDEYKFSLFYKKYGQFVNDIYQETLHRSADEQGLMYYGSLLENNKTTLADIQKSILNSDEGKAIEFSTELDDLYKYILYRPVDNQSLSYYVPLLTRNQTTLTNIQNSLSGSVEYKHLIYSGQYEKFVNDLYEQILNRKSDTQGFAYYTSQLTNKNMTLHDIRLSLLNSKEHKDMELVKQYRMEVELLYQDLLHRQADEQGLNYYVSMMSNGKMTITGVRDSIMSSDEYTFHN